MRYSSYASVCRRPHPSTGYISDTAKASFWNVDYYQHHFDVDTKTVRLFSRSIFERDSKPEFSYHLGPPPLCQHAQPIVPYVHFRAPHARARSLRAVLDAHHAHIHALRHLLARPLHRLLPLVRPGRVRLRASQHRSRARVFIWHRPPRAVLGRPAIRGYQRGVDHGRGRDRVGLRHVRLDTCVGACSSRPCYASAL